MFSCVGQIHQTDIFLDSQTIENRLELVKGGVWEGMGCKSEVSRCKLFHIEFINNKVLLDSTENSSIS